MSVLQSLDITGYKGEPIQNTFFGQRGPADHLAVVFPGQGYTCRMPLLYYTTKVLLAEGADVLNVEYNYGPGSGFEEAAEEERVRRFVEDVTAAYRTALQKRNYRRLTLVGKSMGTLALGRLLTNEETPPQTQAVWLTPLLKDERLIGQIKEWGGRSLFVIGTTDLHYEPTLLEEATSHHPKSRTLAVEGADHSMEISTDVYASLKVLEDVVQAVHSFVDRR